MPVCVNCRWKKLHWKELDNFREAQALTKIVVNSLWIYLFYWLRAFWECLAHTSCLDQRSHALQPTRTEKAKPPTGCQARLDLNQFLCLFACSVSMCIQVKLRRDQLAFECTFSVFEQYLNQSLMESSGCVLLAEESMESSLAHA